MHGQQNVKFTRLYIYILKISGISSVHLTGNHNTAVTCYNLQVKKPSVYSHTEYLEQCKCLQIASTKIIHQVFRW